MSSVYRAPLSTGRVGKKHLSCNAFANTVRGHVCSVHTTHVYVPYRWAMFSSRVVWTGTREHGLRTWVSKMTHMLDIHVHGLWTRVVYISYNCSGISWLL